MPHLNYSRNKKAPAEAGAEMFHAHKGDFNIDQKQDFAIVIYPPPS